MSDRSVHPETLAGDSIAYAGDRAEERRKIAEAIGKRAERGMRLYRERGDEITRVDGDLYLVPGAASAVYTVNLAEETCQCPDSKYSGLACKHLVAASIHRAKHSPGCSHCYDGWVFLGRVVETPDGDEEIVHEPVPCRRCNSATR